MRETWRWIAAGVAFSFLWVATSDSVGFEWLFACVPVVVLAALRSTLLGFHFNDKGFVLHTWFRRRRVAWDQVRGITASTHAVMIQLHGDDVEMLIELVSDKNKVGNFETHPVARARAERVASEGYQRTGRYVAVKDMYTPEEAQERAEEFRTYQAMNPRRKRPW